MRRNRMLVERRSSFYIFLAPWIIGFLLFQLLPIGWGFWTSLTNRMALSTFNGLLRDVIGSGRRNVNTNAWWQARGTNGAARMQRVWTSAGARP